MTRILNFFGALALSTIAFAANTPTQTLTVGQTKESFDQAFTFAQFNPALGTLTSIHFTLAVSDVATSTVTNGSTKSGTYTFTNQSDLYVTDVTGNVIYNEALPTSTQTAVIGPGASKTFSGVPASTSSDTEYDGDFTVSHVFARATNTGNGSPDHFIDASSFVGTGNIGLIFSGDDVSGCAGNAVSCNTSASGGGTASLFYDYITPVITPTTPEPGTMALLTSALLGFGLLMIRRNRA